MIEVLKRDIRTLVQDRERLAEIVVAAQKAALRRHHLLGEPVALWRDGRVVIEVPDDPDVESVDTQ